MKSTSVFGVTICGALFTESVTREKNLPLAECPIYLYHITNNQWKPNINKAESIAGVAFYGVHVCFFSFK